MAFLRAEELEAKLAPPPLPEPGTFAPGFSPCPDVRPARPAPLVVEARAPKAPRPGALARPEARARLVHTFLHHELQAAELFAWAVLAFPDTPEPFRRGLLRLAGEELEHLAAYRAHLATLGHAVGDWPVRDWFWERVPTCADPLAFVAFVGVGLEGANLEHSARYAAAFRQAGDEPGAALLERIEREEVSHVAFAVRWFRHFAGGFDFDRWRAALPTPITPSILRGRPLNVPARRRAGLDEAFLAGLEAVPPA